MTTPARRRPHGALKAAVLEVLVAGDQPLTAREIAEKLSGDPSLTTVFTVLDRLRRSGDVERTRLDTGGYVFAPARAAAGEAAREMIDSLVRANDRGGALVAFAGALRDEDLHVLRRALDQVQG